MFESESSRIWFGSILAEVSLVLGLYWLARRSHEKPWKRFLLKPSRLSFWLLPAMILGDFTAVLGAGVVLDGGPPYDHACAARCRSELLITACQWRSGWLDLVDGRSEIASCSELATRLVLWGGDDVVSEVPVNLVPGELNVLRP